MGRLADFREYLDNRSDALAAAEALLCAVQEKYEQFYAEISSVRETELQQLRGHIIEDQTKIPAAVREELDRAWSEAERELDGELEALEAQRDAHLGDAEAARDLSMEEELAVRKKNTRLDDEEEALKARNEKLLARIEDHNRRIRELGRGFGFFKNLFALRRLQRERRALVDEQHDVVARVDRVRLAWVNAETSWASSEEKLKQSWVDERTEAEAIQAKIDHLTAARERILERSAIEKVLFARQPKLEAAGEGDPACPRCQMRNPASHHFCATCAQRLKADRLDFEGSLLEIAELNRHHAAFSDGMKACQEIIGLVRGLKTGLANFTKSVSDMIATESRYPLPKLSIDVPARSVEYARHFDELVAAAKQEKGLHPKAFSERIRASIQDVYQEPQIEAFFETMGEELSSCANSQW